MLICVLPAVVIVGRLWSLQVDPNSHHLFRIRAEHAKLVRVPPRRGVVLDRNDRVIATNRPVFNLHFVYHHLNPRYIVIEVLCEELGRLGDFPSTHDVQVHLRTLAFEHADAEELLLVEEIPSSAALRIQRRLRHRRLAQAGDRAGHGARSADAGG